MMAWLLKKLFPGREEIERVSAEAAREQRRTIVQAKLTSQRLKQLTDNPDELTSLLKGMRGRQ